MTDQCCKSKSERALEPPVAPEPPPAASLDEMDPADFCPGLLFDASASWVMFVRRLLVPSFYRNKGRPEPGCESITTCTCPCVCPPTADECKETAVVEKRKKKKKKTKSFWSC